MMNVVEIIHAYTKGEMGLEDANEKLKAEGAGYHLEPGKNDFTADDLTNTKVGETPAEANGYGLLDTGSGCLNKVHVSAGKLDYVVNEVQADGSVNMPAFVFIHGKMYTVQGDTLAD